MGGAVATLADVDAVVAYDFVGIAVPYLIEDGAYPALAALSAKRSEPAFVSTRWTG